MRGNVEELVRPVVEASGLDLWDVSYRKEAGRMVLRVLVDRDGGVDLDTISETSERLSRRLDLEGFSAGPGVLARGELAGSGAAAP